MSHIRLGSVTLKVLKRVGFADANTFASSRDNAGVTVGKTDVTSSSFRGDVKAEWV